jgi:hypothetical protein
VRCEPVAVPVPLVCTVGIIRRGFPFVFVVAETVQKHNQRVALTSARTRQREVGIEQRAIKAGDLTGADLEIRVPGAVIKRGELRLRCQGGRRRYSRRG